METAGGAAIRRYGSEGAGSEGAFAVWHESWVSGSGHAGKDNAALPGGAGVGPGAAAQGGAGQEQAAVRDGRAGRPVPDRDTYIETCAPKVSPHRIL